LLRGAREDVLSRDDLEAGESGLSGLQPVPSAPPLMTTFLSTAATDDVGPRWASVRCLGGVKGRVSPAGTDGDLPRTGAWGDLQVRGKQAMSSRVYGPRPDGARTHSLGGVLPRYRRRRVWGQEPASGRLPSGQHQLPNEPFPPGLELVEVGPARVEDSERYVPRFGQLEPNGRPRLEGIRRVLGRRGQVGARWTGGTPKSANAPIAPRPESRGDRASSRG
jgi:hypothetical protein